MKLTVPHSRIRHGSLLCLCYSGGHGDIMFTRIATAMYRLFGDPHR